MVLMSCSVYAQDIDAWRRQATNNPEQLLKDTQAQLQTLSNQRDYQQLALLFAVRSEAYRSLGNESAAAKAIKEGLRFAELSNAPRAQALLYINRSLYFLQRGLQSKAASSAQLAVDAATSSGDSELLAEAKLSVAQVMSQLGDIEGALTTLEAVEREQEINSAKLKMEFHALIGDVYLSAGADDMGISHLAQALEIAKQSMGRWERSVLHYNLGKAYRETGQPEKAQKHFTTAQQLSEQLNDQLGIAYAVNAMGELALQQDFYAQALAQFRQALPFFQAAAAHPMEATTRLNIVECLLGMGQLEAAGETLSATESLIKTLDQVDQSARLAKLWSAFYQKKGNFEDALRHYQDYAQMQQQLLSNNSNRRVQEIMVRLEIKDQEARNKLLNQENQLNQLRLKEQQTSLLLALIAVIAVVLSIIIVSYILWKQIQSRKRFAELALRDELTGAPNRRAVIRACSNALEQQQATISIAIIDFDYFKDINDKYGHDVGDNVLRAFARIVEQCIRDNDRYGRLGGEEWLLLLPNAGAQHAEGIFERIQTRLNQVSIEGLPESVKITFSIGFAMAKAGETFNELYKRTDELLYDAKTQGRSRLIISSSTTATSN